MTNQTEGHAPVAKRDDPILVLTDSGDRTAQRARARSALIRLIAEKIVQEYRQETGQALEEGNQIAERQ